MSDKPTTTMQKKEYYLFTDSRLPGQYIQNFGDRTFIRHSGRMTSIQSGWLINGDPHWEVNEKNLLAIARDTFNEVVQEIEEEEAEERAKSEKRKKSPKFSAPYPSFACQDCGSFIGWLGRGMEKVFGKLHKCE